MIRRFYFVTQSIPFLGSLLRLANSFRKILVFRFARLKSISTTNSFEQKIDQFGNKLISKYGSPQINVKKWPPDAE
jgi:hypothetical protein